MFSSNKTLAIGKANNCLIYGQRFDGYPFIAGDYVLEFSMSFTTELDDAKTIPPVRMLKITAVLPDNAGKCECLPGISGYSACGNSVYFKCRINNHRHFSFWCKTIYNNGNSFECIASNDKSGYFEITINLTEMHDIKLQVP